MRILLLTSTLILLIIISACKPLRPEISLACTEDDLKNLQVKWEIYPRMEGTAKIYISNSPTDFTQNKLVASVDIANGATPPIIGNSKQRSYFKVVFNNQFTQTVATRVLKINGVNNFRDIGGYENINKKAIKWGMIYRSGYLNQATAEGIKRVNSLKIKSAIAYQNNTEKKFINTSDITFADTFSLITQWSNREELINRLSNGNFKRGDGIIYMQDCYLNFLDSEKEMVKKTFRLLADSTKYPIILISNLGKDQIGFITAILLKFAGIPEKVIINDYLLSNEHISRNGLSNFANQIPDESLEGFSMLFSSRPEYLECVFKKMNDYYGGIESYLTDYIGLTQKELDMIRKNILSDSLK